MKSLNRSALENDVRQQIEETLQSPVTVLQIGEGNFLRGFFDWMIQQCRKEGLYTGNIAVTQPRPSGKSKIEALARQDGLYTLVIRGLEHGQVVEKKEIISVFSEVFDPYTDWSKFLALSESPELQFVVSNTTEAGLAYRPETLTEGRAIESFPGKITLLLYRRFLAFQGDPKRGLIFLPCELLERNGDELRNCVIRYAQDWELPEEFQTWVLEHNRFLNSLVDRIVTGYPGGQAEEWFSEWGYEDAMLNTAEPYHLWAIEAEEELDQLLPLKRAGLNVHWVEDLKPYQQRKVRILNGAHTLMAPLGLIHGIEHVRELMEHPEFGTLIREAVDQEIIPTLPYAEAEMKKYASEVFERYLNPFIRHRLTDIAMNSVSKFKVRLLPTLAYYAERGLPLPDGLVRGLAGLLRYYRVKRNGEGFEGTTLEGQAYVVRDDVKLLEHWEALWAEAEHQQEPIKNTVNRLLGSTTLWGQDLSAWTGLVEAVSLNMVEMKGASL